MRWTAASIEDAERLRFEAAKGSDEFLPELDRRSRLEAMRVPSSLAAVDARSPKDVLEAEVSKSDAVTIEPGAVVYYLGDCQARVIGPGRGASTLALAAHDELGGLTYTEAPAALCKLSPAELRDGLLVDVGAGLELEAEGGSRE